MKIKVFYLLLLLFLTQDILARNKNLEWKENSCWFDSTIQALSSFHILNKKLKPEDYPESSNARLYVELERAIKNTWTKDSQHFLRSDVIENGITLETFHHQAAQAMEYIADNASFVDKYAVWRNDQDPMAFIERWAGWIEDSPIEVDRKASIKAAIEKLIKFHIETKIKRLCSHEIESTQIDTPEVGIRIEIPNQQAVVPLLSCLNNYAMPETLNGTNRVRCETCKQNVDATKTFKIDKFPRYLIIQLKRIMQQVGVTYGHNIIVETPISIPSELIINTNSEFISARLKAELGEGSTTYKLCAFISHRFTLSHYIAYVRDKKHWYKYDDMRDTPLIVKKIELQNILDSGKDGKFMPTILFYKKLQKHH